MRPIQRPVATTRLFYAPPYLARTSQRTRGGARNHRCVRLRGCIGGLITPRCLRCEPVGGVGSYESFSLSKTPVSLPRVENTYLASETHLDGTSVRAVAREVSEPRNAPRSAYGVEPPSRTDFPENSDESPTRPIPKYRVAYDRGASITAIGQGSNTVLQGIGILVG